MYRTCLFCHQPLGANETVEALPVGRRLAFDPARGRLWVVCRKCARWNLTPFEERWEALEQCERAFRSTRLRASTDHIGLARLPEGLELVRIGEARRSELAIWRYGELLGKRRRRQLLLTGGAMAAVTAVLIGGPVAGLYTFGAVNVVSPLLQLYGLYRVRGEIVARVPVEGADGRRLLALTRTHAYRSSLVADGRGGWSVELAHKGSGERVVNRTFRGQRFETSVTTVEGAAALRVAGQILPLVNEHCGSAREVGDAVRLIDDVGSVAGCFELAARESLAEQPFASRGLSPQRALQGTLLRLPKAVRLALEMAAHEEGERRAMEGELAELERAWRDAEEIAAIADDLLLPAAAGDGLERLRATAGRSRP